MRIGICGLGSIGRAVSQLLLDHRRGVEIVAAATKEPEAIGKPLAELVGSDIGPGPIVCDDLATVLDAEPETIIYATGSFLVQTQDDIVATAERGVNLVSPCEELAFPFNRFRDYAERIDSVARANGATILGTGVNPGLIFDNLLTTASGASWDIASIRGRRVVDVAGFGENIHLRLGIGYSLEEFERGHDEGSIAGHVGFPESIEMVCERLGLGLDGPVEERFEPLIAEAPAPTRYGEVPSGKSEGFIQRATGKVGGEDLVQFELVLHLRPQAMGMEPVDSLAIEGTHPVRLTLAPGMDAIPATSAMLVNSVPVVAAAEPGLKSVKDLPVAAAWVGTDGSWLR